MKIHEFDPVLYPRKIWVVVKPNMKELEKMFGPLEMDNTAYAVVFHAYNKIENLGGALVIFENKKALTIANITHEALHAAMIILEYIDFNLDYNNQEPLTYLTGWIADCIDRVRKDKNG